MGFPGVRILVVDDAVEVREAFAALLTAEGAEVTVAGTGREALALAGPGRFDVVLTDLGLVDAPGDQLIRELRARGRAPVVVITGLSEPYLTRAREAGADVTFVKPVEWDDVLRYLQRFVTAAAA